MEHPRINHAAVVALRDSRLTEVPVAFVIREPGTQLSEQEVIDFCRGRIASFKMPRRIFFVDQFPLTGSGKIQKYLLRGEAERVVAAEVREPSRVAPAGTGVGPS
jgi:fatty-acyl-CoA synthase